MAQEVTRLRLERFSDERDRTREKREDLTALAEEEKRDLNEYEQEQITKYRTREEYLENEILAMVADLERAEKSKDISRLVRGEGDEGDGEEGTAGIRRFASPRSEDGPVVYRNYAAYAIDYYSVRFPQIAERAAPSGQVREFVEQAQERLERAPVNTLSSNVPGLVPPRHIAQIMDLINATRPVANSGRQVDLDRGTLTYPKIAQRPEVLLQSAEKTEGGTKNLQVTLESLTAETYLGGGDISWQAMTWSSPDTLQLWFDLAAEAYARATESAACEVLESGGASGTIGTVATASRLGTTGTESFANWRTSAIAGISSIYSTTGGRAQTDTLYLSADRFFSLAGLGTDQTLQVSSVGALDIGSMTGTWAGLRVVGSYGFDANTAIVGDASALLIAETPGAPVQLRVVEPSIAGMEVGIVGAFKAAVFDANRFIHLGVHS